MKFNVRNWLAPMGICGLLAFVVVSGNHIVTAQSQPPEEAPVAEVAEVAEISESPTTVRVGIEEDAPEVSAAEEAAADAVASAIASDEDIEMDIEVDDEPPPADSESEDEDRAEQFESRTQELVDQIQEAKANRESERVNELKTELLKITKENFEWLESQRREQVASLEAKLTMLKQVLETRTQNADQIIERRVKTLLNETDSLDWNPKLDTKESWRSRTRSESPARVRNSIERQATIERGLSALKALPAEVRESIRTQAQGPIDRMTVTRPLGIDAGRMALELAQREKLLEARRVELDALLSQKAKLKSLSLLDSKQALFGQQNSKELEAQREFKRSTELVHEKHMALEQAIRAMELDKKALAEKFEFSIKKFDQMKKEFELDKSK